MYIEVLSEALCLWELKKCPSAVLILTFLFLEKSIFTTQVIFLDLVSCNGALKGIYIYVHIVYVKCIFLKNIFKPHIYNSTLHPHPEWL